MLSLFFLFGIITVMNDILIPHLKALFALTQLQASLVQFCFFGAYFIMSYPAAGILKALGSKSSLLIGLATVCVGLLLFYPASVSVSYPLFLTGLFIIGSGFTLLQVVANPYVSLLGPVETGAKRLNMAGFLNSFATTIGPQIGAVFILVNANASATERADSVRGPYLVLAAFVAFLILVFSQVKLPKLESLTEADDDTSTLSLSQKSAFDFAHLRAAMGAIFVYVGVEVAVGSMMIGFVTEYLKLDQQTGANYTSFYWSGLLIGRTVGIGIMQYLKAERALLMVSLAGLLLTTISFAAPNSWVVWPLIALGLCHSIMWPCIFPLGIKGLGKFTSQGSGLMIAMIVGGAVVPLLQGYLIDQIGYLPSLGLLVAGYLYLVWFSVKGHRSDLA